MRIIGAIILTAAAASLGIVKARELKCCSDTLCELNVMLEIMKNEIYTRRSPLKKAILCVPAGRYTRKFIDKLYEELKSLNERTFSQIWSECVNNCLMHLSDEQKSALKELGSTLGRYDAELQAQALDRCMASLSNDYSRLYVELSSKRKMYIGAGTCMGLILSIILL